MIGTATDIGDGRSRDELSDYEKGALAAIHQWKSPERSWVGKAIQKINAPLDLAGDAVLNAADVGKVISKALEGAVSLLNDAAQSTIQPELVYSEYRKRGHEIDAREDILGLDLEEVDRTIGYLAAQYKSIALVEGAGFGALGLPGIPPDLIAILGLNLRAIGAYGTYCGFDVSIQQERLFVLNILGLASSPTDASKQAAMAQLVRIAQDVAKRKTWKELERHAFVTILQRLAKVIGVRLTKAKLAQVIPYAGAVVGGGYNAYFTNKVCDAAFYLWRERFLAAKYGPHIIEVTVDPAEDFEPNYESEEAEIDEFDDE